MYFILCFLAIFFKVSPCLTIYVPLFVFVDGFAEAVFGLAVAVLAGFVVDAGFDEVEGLFDDDEAGFEVLLFVGFVVVDELLLVFVPLFDARVPPPFCLVFGVRACILASSADVM